MKEIIEKYYVFTLTFIVLSIALYGFRANTDIVNIIIGAMVGLIAAPVVTPKSTTITESKH